MKIELQRIYKNLILVLTISLFYLTACGVGIGNISQPKADALPIKDNKSLQGNNPINPEKISIIGDWVQENPDDFNSKYHFDENLTGIQYYGSNSINFTYEFSDGVGIIKFPGGSVLNYYLEGENLFIEDSLIDSLDGTIIFKKVKEFSN